jgi:hypothetical protein
MRNHVPVRIEDINPTFLDYLWRECAVVGFKEIRLNFLIPWLVQQALGAILFVIRDPRAVVASIINRPNFWEFEWPGTYELFIGNILNEPALAHHPVQRRADLMHSARSDVERIAILWALSHAIALDDCEEYGIPIIRYEDLYQDPFNTVRQALQVCHLDPKPIHPSYVFSPSLTTNRTFHGIYSMDKKIERGDFSIFWERTLSAQECAVIAEIVREFGLNYQLEEPGRPYDDARTLGGGGARELDAESFGLLRAKPVRKEARPQRVTQAYG